VVQATPCDLRKRSCLPPLRTKFLTDSARDPNATTPADIQALRDTGLDDGQIFAITGFVALRLAFSTINDALGAQPDAQLARSLPREVREAVTYGRPVAQEPAI